MRFSKKIIALFLVFATTLSSLITPASASWGDNLYHVVITPIDDFFENMIDDCRDAIAAGKDFGREQTRKAYDFWSGLALDFASDYRTFVDTLDSTTASSGIATTGFSASVLQGTNRNGNWYGQARIGYYYPEQWLSVIESLGIQSKVAVISIMKASPYYLFGYYFDSSGRFCVGTFDNPLETVNASLLGVYSYDDLTLINSAVQTLYEYNSTIYYSKSHAQASEDFVTSHCAAFDFSQLPYWGTFSSSNSSLHYYFYFKPSTNTVFNLSSFSSVLSSVYYTTEWLPDPESISWDNSRIIVQPSGTDSSSRGDDLMDMISDYNKTNSYLNSPTAVNYYIGTVNDDGSVDKFFEPGVFDEQTMIFTEPESGTEYQATAWDYNYETRTYGIAFEDGVLSIDGQASNIVLYTLGDDACVLSYYNGETLVKQVSYNYLMVSQSACNINGHTNIVETTKEATCTAPGERTYTCSVCGHQTVEDIPQLEHTYSNYTVQQEPTCTLDGIAANTCLTCGQEVTELLPALGHDWLPTSITDESWSMPDGVSCPDCHGTVFSYEYQDYEVLPGKNLFNPESTLYICNDESLKVYPPKYENGIFYTGARSGYDSGFELCIPVVPGETYTLTYELACGTPTNGCIFGYPDRDATGKATERYVLFISTPNGLPSPYTFTVPQGIYYIGLNIAFGNSRYEVGIKNVQLERGSVATEYEPYDPDYVEIVPPLYHFTCSDCSTEWTAEAIYQHAYTTFTCSRCDETMIQSNEPPMEEQDWFTNFGDALKDFGSNVFKALGHGLTKILSGFVSMVSGIFGFLSDIVFDGVGDFFSGLSDGSITDFFQQENSDGSTTTTLPGEMANGMSRITAFFTGLPADLKGVLTFGIGLMFLLAALKLML